MAKKFSKLKPIDTLRNRGGFIEINTPDDDSAISELALFIEAII